jgi:hypothetical protein
MDCELWLLGRLEPNEEDGIDCKWEVLLRGLLFLVCAGCVGLRLLELTRSSLATDTKGALSSAFHSVRKLVNVLPICIHLCLAQDRTRKRVGRLTYLSVLHQARGRLPWIRYAQAGVLALLASYSVYVALMGQVSLER